MGLTHHDGMSLYGSGLYWGMTGGETAIIQTSGYLNSGRLGTASEAVTTLPGAIAGKSTGLNIDAGKLTCGSTFHASISTALSSIASVVANITLPAVNSTWIYTSGRPEVVDTVASGHCFDIWLTRNGTLSGVLTSHNVSSFVNWIAVGT